MSSVSPQSVFFSCLLFTSITLYFEFQATDSLKSAYSELKFNRQITDNFTTDNTTCFPNPTKNISPFSRKKLEKNCQNHQNNYILHLKYPNQYRGPTYSPPFIVDSWTQLALCPIAEAYDVSLVVAANFLQNYVDKPSSERQEIMESVFSQLPANFYQVEKALRQTYDRQLWPDESFQNKKYFQKLEEKFNSKAFATSEHLLNR